MKFEKWTLGLAAVGAVSLASAARAEEKLTALQTALSSTTISGYVDTSAQWNLGTGNSSVAPVKFQGPGKADGFNLNVVQLTISKPLDESDWAAGYRADLWFGPDANTLNTHSIFASGGRASAGDLAVRQAYVALRTPIGNGIEWKFGVFDSIIGYESVESGNNPNYTRSYGHTIEPQTHTGVLGTYRFNEILSVAAGVANTIGPAINERAHGPNAAIDPDAPVDAESYKAYMGSIALTAPESWGWAAGSTLYGGVVNGFSSGVIDNVTSWYVGATLATPVTGLKLGAAFDYLDAHNFPSNADSVWALALYASYQATEKLSLHLRGEHLDGETPSDDVNLYALTATVQYDLWKNVISRLEFRWDHADNPSFARRPFGGRTGSGSVGGGSDIPDYFETSSSSAFEDYHSDSVLIEDLISGVGGSLPAPGDRARKNAYMLALNIIYKF
ncbi:MAG: porin [Verrucomicrobiae bacterium]|nr:porin [Verrucomicrobiae bacterium]